MLIVLLAFPTGFAQAKNQDTTLLVKTQIFDDQTVYPSRFFKGDRAWYERLTFSHLDVPAEWANEGRYYFEFWNKNNRPITGAQRLTTAPIPLDILNQKDITTFRLVVFVPPGVEHPNITSNEPGEIRVVYDQSVDTRLLSFIGLIGVAFLGLLIGSFLLPFHFAGIPATISFLLHKPLKDLPTIFSQNIALMWIILGFSGVFGLSIGLFSGGIQPFFVLLKLPALIFLTLLLSFLAIMVFSQFFSANLSFSRLFRLSLRILAFISLFLASFSPILWIFTLLQTSHDTFLLFTLFLSGMASLAGFVILYKSIREHLGAQSSLALAFIWLFVFMFVGVEMGWLMRPWVGLAEDPTGTLPIVRLYSGNAFEEIFRLTH